MNLPIAALSLLLALCACATPPAEERAVDRVLAEDARFGRARDEAPRLVPIAQAVEGYVAGLASVKLTDCPDDFAVAFTDHSQAWALMVPFLRRYPDLRGELHDVFEWLESEDNSEAEEFKKLLQAVWDTWKKVEEASSPTTG